jgi:GTPase
MKAIVAIVGRPNVGKSSLFNRLAGRRLALVEDVPGVTRDRHYADVEWMGRTFTLVDTGGFLPEEEGTMLAKVREQAQLAVEESEVIVFVVDGRAGLTPADEAVASYLRKSGKPIVVAVNKLDSPAQEATSLLPEIFRLGLEPVVSVSAEHNRGADELMDELLPYLGPAEEEDQGEPAEGAEEDEESRPVRVAIIGRPNVGKSTLVNALLGQERVVASEQPGTTTDAIDSALDFQGQPIVLTDTAGIRRKKAIAQRVEQFSVIAALKVVERSDVAALVLDATEPAVDQDARIAAVAEEKFRPLIIVVNKWDLVERGSKTEEEGRAWVKQRFRFAAHAPVVFASALKRERTRKVLELAVELTRQFRFRAPTPVLNRLLEAITESHPAPIARGKPLRLYYIAQVAVAPPTFVLTCNLPERVPEDYKRYITNQLRKTFDLRVPIRLLFRPRPGQAKRSTRRRQR